MENLTKFFILFFVLSVFLAACGNQTQVVKNDKSDDTVAAPSADAKGDLKDIMDNKATNFMATYEISGVESFSEMSLYWKDDKFRYDFENEEGKGSLFFMDGKLYSCSKQDDQDICVDMGEQEAPETFANQFSADLDNYNIFSKPSRTIAGQTARCYGFTDTENDVDWESCYSNDNALLYSKTTNAEQTIELKATKYSKSVSDADFELPAEPQDVSAMMAQYQQP